MAFEQKDGDIAIFRNDKDGNEKRPDMRGTATIGGVVYSVSMWKRTPKAGGEAYLSGRIERRDSGQYSGRAQQSPPAQSTQQQPAEPSAADELPF